MTTDTGETGVRIEFIPRFELVRTSPRARSTLLYGLRMGSEWRSPGTESFLLFHQLTATQRLAVTRRLAWVASGNVNFGKMDYSQSLFLSGTNIGDDSMQELASSLPQTQVVRYLTYAGNTGLLITLNRKQQLGVNASYSENQQLSGASPQIASTEAVDNPWSRTASINANLSSRLPSAGLLSATITGSLSVFSNDSVSLPVTALLGWSYRWRENASLSLQAGTIFLAETYDNTVSSEENADSAMQLSVLPSGGGSVAVRPLWNTITTWNFSAGVSVSTYVDTIRAAVLPRMNTVFAATSDISPRVQFQSSISATTILVDEVRGVSLDNNTFPAAASLSTGLSFEVADMTFIQVGGQANTQMSYPFNAPVKMGSRELVGLVSFSMEFAPSDSGVNDSGVNE